MKYKLMAVLACALAVLAFVPGKAFAADPASFLNFGSEQDISTGTGGCTIKLKYFTLPSSPHVAVGQMKHAPGTLTCRGESFIEIVAQGSSEYVGQRCYISPDSTHVNGPDGLCSTFTDSGSTIYQSYISSADVVGVHLSLCPASGGSCTEYRRTFSTADPAYFTSVQPDWDCQVDYQHGDYSTTGLARMLYSPASGSCRTDLSYIEVNAVDNATGGVKTQRCYMDGTGSGDGSCSIYSGGFLTSWYQAYIANAHVLNATANLCGEVIPDPCRGFFFHAY